MWITKNEKGIIPLDSASIEVYEKIKRGQEYQVDIKQPRNIKFHRKFFNLVNAVYSMQDYYNSIDVFRSALTIEAGYFYIIFTDGKENKIPKSISFTNMDNTEFENFYNNAIDASIRYLEQLNGVKYLDRDIQVAIDNILTLF